MKKILLCLCCIVFLFQATQPAGAILDGSVNNSVMRNYIMGPGDVFTIKVYDFAEFDQEKIKVAPDGSIVLANIGILNISGMSLEQFYNVVYEKLCFYLKDPQITIKLEKTKPILVYVNGAVQNPGSYELKTESTENSNSRKNDSDTYIERTTPLLSNVLAAAGGIKYNADLENITIKNNYTNAEIKVNLLELLEGDTSQDIYLVSKDVVYIPELPTSYAVSDKKYTKYVSAIFSPKKVPVKVLGYVNKPGLIYLNTSDSLNLNAAITSAGGYYKDTPYPPKKVYISRVDKTGKLTTITCNPMNNDLMLRPNDIIYIPEKIRPKVGRAFDYLNRVVNPFNNFANSYNNWALMFDPHRYQVIGK